jgi:predicted metal-dependent hydrolase
MSREGSRDRGLQSNLINVSGLQIQVVRKAIKNLNVRVYPPHGRVRVAAPLRVSDKAVRLAVVGKLGWIKRQQARVEKQSRQSAREYVTGESHHFQGRRYRLNVTIQAGPAHIELRETDIIHLSIEEGSTLSQRERVFREWHRRQLEALIPPLIEKWERKIGVNVGKVSVRHMKTKWGVCNIRTHRISLNLELVKKPLECVEYVIAHEMVHLLERLHNDRFKAFMDEFVPSWRLLKKELDLSDDLSEPA